MLSDVARAYFEAPVKREICIELPEEDWELEDGQEDLVGVMNKSLYGTRNAAASFQQYVKMFMEGVGFKQGKYNPCTYWHPVRDLKSLVHGDDFATSGEDEDLPWLKQKMDGRGEMQTQMVCAKHPQRRKGGEQGHQSRRKNVGV